MDLLDKSDDEPLGQPGEKPRLAEGVEGSLHRPGRAQFRHGIGSRNSIIGGRSPSPPRLEQLPLETLFYVRRRVRRATGGLRALRPEHVTVERDLKVGLVRRLRAR